MELTLKRKDVSSDRTVGQLFVNGEFSCFTLEDPVRHGPKIAHETAIPAGRYRVDVRRSQRFGRMLPLVCEVPGFTGIRIHPGNTAADTSGCILVGLSAEHDSVASSRLAMNALQPKIAGALARGEDVWLTVQDPPS